MQSTRERWTFEREDNFCDHPLWEAELWDENMRSALGCQGRTPHIFSSNTLHVNPTAPPVLQIHEFFMNLPSDSLLHSTEGQWGLDIGMG